jgi:hypothetical protein
MREVVQFVQGKLDGAVDGLGKQKAHVVIQY